MQENKRKLFKLHKVKEEIKGAIVGFGVSGIITTPPTFIIMGGAGHINIYPYVLTVIGMTTTAGSIIGVLVASLNFHDENYEKEKEYIKK